ncbi:MAG: protein-disulfide reductase DsbD [Chromatiales bacterium]|nr:protein-disulfide reductase DsbD [Chromatiales bacterium]
MIDAFAARWRALLWIFAALWAGAAGAITDDDLLPPEQAFALQAPQLVDGAVRLSWRVADGYYLYRSKFKVLGTTEGVTLGDPIIPPGEKKNDPFFGDIEIFRGAVSIDVPYQADPLPDALDLKTTVQGCADIGVCYPPFHQTVTIALAGAPAAVIPVAGAPALAATALAPLADAVPATPLAVAGLAPALGDTAPAAGPFGGSALDGLTSLSRSLGFNDDEDDLLPPDQAFQFIPEVVDGNRLRMQFQAAPGYYLYRDKIKLELVGADARLGTVELPRGETKDDPSFGTVEVYHGLITADVAVERAAGGPLALDLKAAYQGCAERGVCYPPIKKTIAIELPATTVDSRATAVAAAPVVATPVVAAPAQTASAPAPVAAAPAAPVAAPPESEQDELAKFLLEKPLIVSAGLFFLLGLGLAFTPCVFPMIPILSGIIIGQGDKLTTRKAFVLSLVYVLAMGLTYTVVGVLAGLGGANLQIWFQNPWVLSIFAAIFVLLSLSMFGFYELQMPGKVQSWLSNVSNRQQGGSLTGVAVMGFLSALIVGPCVTAPLIGALIVIGQTGDAVLGGTALFALSMGMGAPLLAIGTSAGKLLPRAGVWMDAVKAFFGVGLLAVAIWLLERILPVGVTLLLWGTLLIASGVYLGALDPVGRDGPNGWRRFWKSLGVVVALYGALQIIGAASGAREVWQPLRGLTSSVATGGAAGTAAPAPALGFQKVKGTDGLDAALAQAAARGQPVMLDFYADWCISCKELEHYTFSDAKVVQSLSSFLVLQTDVTDNDAADQALLKRFGLIGPPAILFFTPDGTELRAYRKVGFVPAEAFVTHVEHFKTAAQGAGG